MSWGCLQKYQWQICIEPYQLHIIWVTSHRTGFPRPICLRKGPFNFFISIIWKGPCVFGPNPAARGRCLHIISPMYYNSFIMCWGTVLDSQVPTRPPVPHIMQIQTLPLPRHKITKVIFSTGICLKDLSTVPCNIHRDVSTIIIRSTHYFTCKCQMAWVMRVTGKPLKAYRKRTMLPKYFYKCSELIHGGITTSFGFLKKFDGNLSRFLGVKYNLLLVQEHTICSFFE